MNEGAVCASDVTTARVWPGLLLTRARAPRSRCSPRHSRRWVIQVLW